MYVPKAFLETDPDCIRDFIRRYSFGTLISWDGKRPVATRLPLNLSEDDRGHTYLSGHIAKANPQSETFGSNDEVLVQFDGPHAYISATWYSIQSVPTWDYITVQAYGSLRKIENRDELYAFLKAMVDSQEKYAPESSRYRLESLSPDLLNNMMNAIMGFQIVVTKIECATKLSQNRNSHDYENIIARLEQLNDSQSGSVAAEMKARRKKYDK